MIDIGVELYVVSKIPMHLKITSIIPQLGSMIKTLFATSRCHIYENLSLIFYSAKSLKSHFSNFSQNGHQLHYLYILCKPQCQIWGCLALCVLLRSISN